MSGHPHTYVDGPRVRARQRGVSLIEAMVALAVMGVGTLAVLGVQTGLRLNGDVAKQRGEAVRIAQETMEQARSFNTLAEYTALVSAGPTAVVGYTTNTAYQIDQNVLNDQTSLDHPRRKTVRIQVSWQDRTGQVQTVQLQSDLQGTPPALAGTLLIPSERSIMQRPMGRHRSIPNQAVPHGDGTSRFPPPGGGGVSWVFNNTTGYITSICKNAGTPEEACLPFDARLLAGYVRFATAAAPPTAADAELPQGDVQPVEVEVDQTHPVAQVGTVQCAEETLDGATRAYYCAVPVGTMTTWSGRATVQGLALATSVLEDADDTRFRICRYTLHREHRAVGAGIPPMRNLDHPLDYSLVGLSLTNQNFLVIRAGNGTAAYDCPADDPSTEQNTTTWHHQPAS